jgi:hypothetical protein
MMPVGLTWYLDAQEKDSSVSLPFLADDPTVAGTWLRVSRDCSVGTSVAISDHCDEFRRSDRTTVKRQQHIARRVALQTLQRCRQPSECDWSPKPPGSRTAW